MRVFLSSWVYFLRTSSIAMSSSSEASAILRSMTFIGFFLLPFSPWFILLTTNWLFFRIHWPINYQSSSRIADRPSASSTQDGSYFVFPITAPQEGQVSYGLSYPALHLEQIYSSALKRCVFRIQWTRFILVLSSSPSSREDSCRVGLVKLLRVRETYPACSFASNKADGFSAHGSSFPINYHCLWSHSLVINSYCSISGSLPCW